MEDTKLGRGDKDDPAEVARDGVAAMLAGKDRVVAGSALNKLQAAAAKVMPEPAKAAVQRKNFEPSSGR
jgi:hypothetical protein